MSVAAKLLELRNANLAALLGELFGDEEVLPVRSHPGGADPLFNLCSRSSVHALHFEGIHDLERSATFCVADVLAAIEAEAMTLASVERHDGQIVVFQALQ